MASQSEGHVSGYLVGFAAGRLACRNPRHAFNVILDIIARSAQYLPIIRFVSAAFAGRFNVVELQLKRVALAAYRTAMVVRCQYRSEFVSTSFAHIGQSQIPNFVRVGGHVLCLAVHGSHYARMSESVNPLEPTSAKII